MIKVSIENLGLEDLSREIKKGVQKGLSIAASDQVARIRSRTSAGRDVEGVPFRGYSKSYLDQIHKTGKATGTDGQRRSKSASPVNLTVSGQMLGAMQVKKYSSGEALGARIFFLKFGEIAAALNERREFFGVSDSDGDTIEAAILDSLAFLSD